MTGRFAPRATRLPQADEFADFDAASSPRRQPPKFRQLLEAFGTLAVLLSRGSETGRKRAAAFLPDKGKRQNRGGRRRRSRGAPTPILQPRAGVAGAARPRTAPARC